MNKQWKHIPFDARINRELEEQSLQVILRLVPGVIVLLLNVFDKTMRYQYQIDQIGLLTMLS